MSLAASPPPASMLDIDTANNLDDEIAHVRAEIQALTQHRKLLTSSLLASTKVQSRLFNTPTSPTSISHDDSTAPLNLTNLQEHTQSNAHRLALGVTAFPFTDPSPEFQSKNPLLGVRFDICNRLGKFDSAYYIFCMRANDTGEELRIYRHTIPAVVPLEQYERECLPLAASTREDDEGYVGSDGAENEDPQPKKQSLHSLVGRVRYDLVSWRLRQDAAEWLKDELGLSGPRHEKRAERDSDMPDNTSNNSDNDDDELLGSFNVESLEAQEVDARQIRIIWSDDRVGRLKMSNTGKIEKAVVIGEDGERVRDVERTLMGSESEQDGVSVKQLVERLEIVYQKSEEKKEREVQKSHEMARIANGLGGRQS
ncbi:hypothetical protein H2200_006916 [Cladophialophora chaetospira]|uniref:Uncharacterized protein n=1 Tax=Cladophialophora chaetospira TaxID=386627 RepID=A0AA38X989_9EURO|nr:hypothetical protein H2200_006916 [Cladophialophora chaetospira]